MRKWGRTFWAWSCFALGLAFAVWIGSVSPSFQKCTAEHEKGADQNEADQSHKIMGIRFSPRIGVFFRCQGAFIDENSSTLTAVATIAIAAFTLTLWRATTEQGRLTRDAVSLARDEFNATHRPELTVREVAWAIGETMDGTPGTYGSIVFTLINRGRTSCEIIESVIEFSPTSGNGQAVRTWERNELGPITFAAGQFRTFSHKMTSILERTVAASQDLRISETHYFRGSVIYADKAGIRRRFAFTRVCTGGDSDRFDPSGNPEDEYND